MKKYIVVLVLLASCKNLETKFDIFVSVPPQKYFVEKIVAETKRVTSVVGDNGNPETFEITLQNLKKLETADLFFTIGVPYEYSLVKALDRKKNIHVEVKNMAHYAQYRNFTVNQWHDEEEHTDADIIDEQKQIDPHIWLSLKNAPKLARYTYEALIMQYPEQELKFTQNYNALVQELIDFDLIISSKLDPYRSRMFLIYHPALGYIADEYDLIQIPIQWKQQERSVAQIKTIINTGIKNSLKTVFIQDGFPIAVAKNIANKLGGNVYVVDPLNVDWQKNILEIVNALVRSFVK